MPASFLRELGKCTQDVMRRVFPPMVHKDDICDVVGYTENAGAPAAVVPKFIGERLFDTVAGAWYMSYGTAAGEWTPLGESGISAAELAVLNGASSTPTASKAVVADSAGAISLAGNVALTPGAGLSGAAKYVTSVTREGDIIKTQILIDLEGLFGGGTADDIIGNDGAGVAYLGQITAAKHGTIIGGLMQCLETPAGSNVDVDLWSADEATGVEDTAISALTNEVQLINHGNWAAAETDEISAFPVADQYLYLTSGAATAGAFTAGKFLITLYGHA